MHSALMIVLGILISGGKEWRENVNDHETMAAREKDKRCLGHTTMHLDHNSQ